MLSRALQRAPAEIEREFINLCAYHPRFMDRELTHAEKIQLEGFARTYAEYETLIGGPTQDVSKDARFQMPLEQWKAQSPVNRYIQAEASRAKDIRSLYKAWEKLRGGIAPGPRLDVGSRSNFFATAMNIESIVKEHGDNAQIMINTLGDQGIFHSLKSPWYAADIPLSKPLPTAGTPMDRNKVPGFQEIGPDGKLPHNGVQFQAITLNMVLHHVDPDKLDTLIKDAYDRLAPGGKLFVLEDVIGWEKEDPVRKKIILDFVDGFFYPDALGHQKPMAEWKSLIEKAGFKHLIDSKYKVRNIVGIAVEEGMMAFEKPQNP